MYGVPSMARASALRQTLPRLSALLLMLLQAMVAGQSGDRSQPIQIEADQATLDENTGISTYTGNVRLSQGSLKLSGDRMTVSLQDDAVDRVVLTGTPASYSQQPDDEESPQQAEAGRIEYQAGRQRMILLGNARIWRDESEEFISNRIIINLQDNTVNAGSDTPDGRVRIILQPKTWQQDEETVAE